MLNDIKKLEMGKQQEIKVFIKSAETSKTRTGEIYQKLTVRDENDHEAMVFNFKEQIKGALPMVVTALIDTSEFRESANFKMMSYKIDSNAKPENFLPKAEINKKEILTALSQKSKSVRMGLRKIVAEILNEHVVAFGDNPFSKSGVFSRTCGILEATYKLTCLAESATTVLGLDRDLMIAGAMLYYIGKIKTIDNAYNYTPDDVLLGNGLSAAMIVQAKVLEIQNGSNEELKKSLDDTDIKLLEHILTSRFKGIQTAIPEACVLRYLDAIITETEAMTSIIKEESEHNVITQNHNLFAGRMYIR